MDSDRTERRRAGRRRALAPGLYLVATPIGNARDITPARARHPRRAPTSSPPRTPATPASCWTIHGVRRDGARILPYHDHNGAAQRPRLLAALAEGRSVALVSDAGTPLVADPGYRLAVEAIAAGHAVTAVPGASALLAALSVAGLPTDRFLFAGFLPPRAGRPAPRARRARRGAGDAGLLRIAAPAGARASPTWPRCSAPTGRRRSAASSPSASRRSGAATLARARRRTTPARPAPKGEVVVRRRPAAGRRAGRRGALDAALGGGAAGAVGQGRGGRGGGRARPAAARRSTPGRWSWRGGR